MRRRRTRIKASVWAILSVIVALGCAGLAGAAFAQSSAQPVVTGYLTTVGCPTGVSTCFVQYGASGSSTKVIPTAATTANDSGTVTTGGAFQSVIAASASRLGCTIQNPTSATEPLYVFFGTNASASENASITLGPGASVSCAAGVAVLTDNVSVTAATTGHAFVAMNQ